MAEPDTGGGERARPRSSPREVVDTNPVALALALGVGGLLLLPAPELPDIVPSGTMDGYEGGGGKASWVGENMGVGVAVCRYWDW
jgi:hypothetical protein